jgi:hypothetical protein
MNTYSFSFTRTVNVTSLKRRPLWAFWRHDTLDAKTLRSPVTFEGLSEYEGNILRRWLGGGNTDEYRLLMKVAWPDVDDFRLSIERPVAPAMPAYQQVNLAAGPP